MFKDRVSLCPGDYLAMSESRLVHVSHFIQLVYEGFILSLYFEGVYSWFMLKASLFGLCFKFFVLLVYAMILSCWHIYKYDGFMKMV